MKLWRGTILSVLLEYLDEENTLFLFTCIVGWSTFIGFYWVFLLLNKFYRFLLDFSSSSIFYLLIFFYLPLFPELKVRDWSKVSIYIIFISFDSKPVNFYSWDGHEFNLFSILKCLIIDKANFSGSLLTNSPFLIYFFENLMIYSSMAFIWSSGIWSLLNRIPFVK